MKFNETTKDFITNERSLKAPGGGLIMRLNLNVFKMADIQKLNVNSTTYDISVPWGKVTGTSNIVTTNTTQTITGVKTFKYDSWGVFELLRNANNYDSVIKYSNISDGALGYMGFGGSASPADIAKKPYWSPDGNALYPLIHSGNISSYALTSLPSHTHTKSQITDFSHSHDYLPLTGGTMTGDMKILFGDTDKFIMWDYDGDGNAGASWRIGSKGSGSGNTNYFCIESGTSGISESAWNNILNIGQNDFIVYFSQIPKVGSTNVSLEGHTHSYLTSITKKMVTDALGYTPPQSDTNTWRGITDSYSGTDSTISLSQKGGNSLYNALVNGYASTAGSADSMSSYSVASSSATKRRLWISWDGVDGKPAYSDNLTFQTSTNTLFVGNTAVSLNGHTHNGYASSSHTHDDRYYTESEINTKLAGKSDTHSHPYLSTSGGTISSSGWNAQLHINRTSSSGSWGPAISFDYDGACNGTLTMSSNKLYVGDNGSTRTEVSLVGHTHSYAASSHTHDYLSLSGGTLSGMLTIEKSSASSDAIYWVKTTNSNHYLGFGEGTSGNRGIYDQNLGWVFKIASNDVTTVYANGGFYQSSDERLKTFYEPIKVDLDKLKTLRKNYFKFNDKEDKLEIGVSAQEIQEIYPELVTADEEGYLSVAYDKLSVIALKAIDELDNKYQKEINDLNDQLSTIKNILKEKGIL